MSVSESASIRFSISHVPNLLLFLLICQKNIAVAMQLNKVVKKKPTSHNKNQNAASHLQDVSETHGGWVQIRRSQTFMVRALGCKLRSLYSLKITSMPLTGLYVECFLPSLPSPQKATSLLAPDLNKYLQPQNTMKVLFPSRKI